MTPAQVCGYCHSTNVFALGELLQDRYRGWLICRDCRGRTAGEWREWPPR